MYISSMNLLVINVLIIFTYVTAARSTIDNISRKLRINKAWQLLQHISCDDIRLPEDCENIKKINRNLMNVYIGESNTNDLVVSFVEKIKGKLTRHNGIIVIDPYPSAHFGHTILLFVIDVRVPIVKCQALNGISYINGRQQLECLYIAGTDSCRNQIGHSRKGRRRCEFNHIPLVYKRSDSNFNQKLQCLSNFEGFSSCRTNKPVTMDRCMNSGRCSSPSSSLALLNQMDPFCFEKCDQAILVSGGWNYFMNQPRHLENMKSMWDYLKSKGYLERSIQIFHANNGSIDLDGNQKTKDVIPATEAGGILRHIRNVCQRGPRCLDTLTIYLNGPTLKNGNLLLWDRNHDGIADGTEMLRVRQLLETLHYCNATHINIIADQNYAGHLVEKVKDGYKSKVNPVFKKISVFASSSKRSYTWRKDFTKKWIEFDEEWHQKNYTETGRQLGDVFRDVQQELAASKQYSLTSFESPSNNKRTIYGKVGERVGCSFNRNSLSRIFFRFPRRTANSRTTSKTNTGTTAGTT